MNKIMFSIIVPIYNIEKYIEECIVSIINQTYAVLEIILVDDGSSDNSLQICNNYKMRDSRIKVIHKENGGATSARKMGSELATGEYIAYIDGDDWICKDYFENFARIIEKYDTDIVCCAGNQVEGIQKKIIPYKIREGIYRRKDIEEIIFPILIENEYGISFSGNLWGKVCKRELILPEIRKMNDEIIMGEDATIIKPCVYRANSLYIMNEPLYNYRYNPNSLTKGKNVFRLEEPYERAKHMEQQMEMEKYDFQKQLYRLTIHALFNVVVSQFNRKESYFVISSDVKKQLSHPYYVEAIKKCNFKSRKGKFALFSLKNRWIVLIKLYYLLKKK